MARIMRWFTPLLTVLTFATTIFSAPVQARGREPISMQLGPVSKAPVFATVAIADDGAQTWLLLEAGHLVAGHHYLVHLHSGTCAVPGASTGFLGEFVADKDGRGRLATVGVRLGGSGALVDLGKMELADGGHSVDLHAGSSLVACGDVPSRADAILPPSGRPSYGEREEVSFSGHSLPYCPVEWMSACQPAWWPRNPLGSPWRPGRPPVRDQATIKLRDTERPVAINTTAVLRGSVGCGRPGVHQVVAQEIRNGFATLIGTANTSGGEFSIPWSVTAPTGMRTIRIVVAGPCGSASQSFTLRVAEVIAL